MPLMHNSIIYHMRCSSTEPFPWPHIWYACNLYKIFFFFFWKVESPSSQSSSPAIWDFSAVILVEQKGRGDTHSDWVGSKCRNQPSQKWSLFHFIIKELSQSGIDLNWTYLVLNQVGLVHRLKCFILLFICVCQIKPGTFLWGAFIKMDNLNIY